MLKMWAVFCALLSALSWQVAAQSPTDSEWEGFKSVQLRTHSLAQPYLDSDMSSRWFDFGGDTVIRADKYVRLTPDKQSRQGWLYSRVPLTATNWEIEFEYKITGQGSLYGDGFALWLTKQRATPGPVFGATDKFEGLGIFFDTYKNNRPGTVFPYVMAMLGDGETTYDQANDGKANELAGCSARGIRNANIPTKARLTYFQDQKLVLKLLYKDDHTWTDCFEVPNIKIPTVAYLGFTAETGELSDNHDIISVDTKNLYAVTPNAQAGTQQTGGTTRNPPTFKAPSEGGSWGWFVVKIMLFFIVIGGAYVGFTVYRSNQRRGRF